MEGYQLWCPEDRSEWESGILLLVRVAAGAALTMPGQAPPCRVVGTITRGMPAAQGLRSRSAQPRLDGEQRATRLLAAIGVPANLLGCVYLRTALRLLEEHPQMRRSLMHTLYPQVAQQHGTTAKGVERAIRHAITQTWARGGEERCRQLLGRMSSCVGDRPTNSEFITLLSDRLAMEQRAQEERRVP